MSHEIYVSEYTRKVRGSMLHLPPPVAEVVKARNHHNINLPVAGSKGRFKYISVYDYGVNPNYKTETPLGQVLFCPTDNTIKLTGAVKHFLGIEGILAKKEVKIIGNHDKLTLWTLDMWEEYNRYMNVPARKKEYQEMLEVALEL